MVAVAHGGARHPGEQRGHVAAGALLGEAFQVLAAGIHQRDDGRGERLPDQKGGGHRQRGDDVEADIAAPQAGRDLGQEGEQDGDSGDGPDRIRPGAEPGERRHQPSREPERGEAGEEGPELEA